MPIACPIQPAQNATNWLLLERNTNATWRETNYPHPNVSFCLDITRNIRMLHKTMLSVASVEWNKILCKYEFRTNYITTQIAYKENCDALVKYFYQIATL